MVDRPSPQTVWTSQATEGFTMPVAEIRKRADKLHKTVRSRNWREYAMSAVLIAVFGWLTYALPGLLMKAGSVLTILGILTVAWQLHRRASAQVPPLEGSVLALMAFHRGALVRQRDALHAMALWYLGPLVPGPAVLLVGRAVRAPTALLPIGVTIVLFVVVFGLTLLLNRWGAAQLQKQIDALDVTTEAGD